MNLSKFFSRKKYFFFIQCVVEEIILSALTLEEIVDYLDAKVLLGGEQLNRLVYGYSIAAMHLENYLDKLHHQWLVITPGDRGDILVGLQLANESANYGEVPGILLTAGCMPKQSILSLVEGMSNPIPVLVTEDPTYVVAKKLDKINARIYAKDKRKIAAALKIFNESVDTTSLLQKAGSIKSRLVTPRMFEYTLVELVQKSKKNIVLPEGMDERILKAAEVLTSRGIVDLTLLGDEKNIRQKIYKLGLQLKDVAIINPVESPERERYALELHKIRQHKGIDKAMARSIIIDVNYFATMMVYLKDVDGMVSGAAHTTQQTIRPALQIIKTQKNCAIVSSVFLMCLADKVLVYGDCAINPTPNAEELAHIAMSSCQTARQFNIEPRVALLSYSSGKSGKGEEVDKVSQAERLLRKWDPTIEVAGPIQYDAAVSPEVAKIKMPHSNVAGNATVLIFPDLNTGNNTYKAVQRETNAIAIGPILQGLAKPINDLSRGCTINDVINTVIITAIQAQSF